MNEINNNSLVISDAAAQRILQQVAKQQNPDLGLRLSVESGGCSGFKYVFKFDEQCNQDDKIISHLGAKIIIDELSLSLIAGSKLDYIQTLGQAGFEVINPKATARCGCGTSFSL